MRVATHRAPSSRAHCHPGANVFENRQQCGTLRAAIDGAGERRKRALHCLGEQCVLAAVMPVKVERPTSARSMMSAIVKPS
ncbi:MAG: hypothetical protein WBV61_11220 [Rhodanobacteraceae bacterium]